MSGAVESSARTSTGFRERMIMSEDKRQIISLLTPVLQATRQCWDLADLEYSGPLPNGDENVTAFFLSGGRKVINISGDSGIALISDIARGLM